MGIKARELFERRKRRTRYGLKSGLNNTIRLSVFRSSKNIYAQVIDDSKGVTLVSASTIEKSPAGSNCPVTFTPILYTESMRTVAFVIVN